MKTRAVLVGSYNGQKLFYLLTPHGEQKYDGALVSKFGRVEYLPFFQFITTTGNIQEFKFSKFHRFLWEPAPRNEDRNRWSRMFLSKTQPVDDELLVGTKIITELTPAKQEKKSAAERAFLFQRKLANPSSPHMDGTQLTRSFVEPLRGVIGLKGLGPSLRVNRSIDGDGDGFVDDGLPTMRPFIPGFDLVADAIDSAQSMRSIRTDRADTTKDRSISRETMFRHVQDINDHVAVRHNGGKPLKTKADALGVLTKLIPGFGRTDKGRSYIEFLDDMQPEDELHPWQEAYLSQFIFMVEDEPLRNTVRWKLSRMDTPTAESGVNGQTSAPRRTKGWEPVAPSLIVRGTSGRMRPKKMYDQPGIEIQYTQNDDFASLQGWEWILRPDKKNYNVLSSAISKEMQNDAKKVANLNEAQQISRLIRRRREQIDTLSQFVASFPLPQNAEVSLAANMSERFRNFINQALPMVMDTVDAINSIDSTLLGVPLKDTLQVMLGGTLNEMRFFLDNVSMATMLLTTQGKYKPTIDAVNGVIEEWSPVNQSFVGIHEMTHALHFLRMRDAMHQRAKQLRTEYLSALRKQFETDGRKFPDESTLQEQLPIEAFHLDVYKETLKSFAKNNPDEFRRRLLYWGTSNVGILSRTEYESDGVTPRPGTDALVPSYLGRLADIGKLLLDHQSIGGGQLGKLLGLQSPISKQESSELARDIFRLLDKAIYFGNEPIRMNAGIARLLNDISNATGDTRLSNINKPGDALTPYHLLSVLLPDILNYETSSHRNDFRGATLGVGSNFPSAFILETLGYPDTRPPGSSTIVGLSAEDAKPLADALIGIAPMMDRIHDSISSLGASVSEFDRILTATEPQILIRPNEALLPAAFGQLGITTLDDLYNADIDTLLSAVNASIDEVGINRFVRAQLPDANGRPSQDTTPVLFELLPNAVLELAPFSEAEKEQLREISGRIGLPASPGAILRNDAPGYASYQATLVPQPTFLSSEGFSLAEFAAETGLSEMLGIPLAQIAKGGGVTRALSNDELQLVVRYMLWILGGRFPGDKLARFDEVPR